MINVIPDIARHGAEKFSGQPAICAGNQVISYRELWTRIQNGAKQLGPGGPVALYAVPGPDWLAGLFAVLCAGRCVVPVSYRETGDYLNRVFAVAGVEQVICSASLKAQVSGNDVVDPVLLGRAPMSGALPEVTSEDRALISFTSGSTQEPKAVVLSHRNIVANIQGLIAVQQVDSDDNFLSVLPPNHLFELVVGNLAPMVLGASIHYAGSTLPNRLIQALNDRSVSYILLVPALLEMLVREVIDMLVDTRVLDDTLRNASLAKIGQCCSDLPDDVVAAARKIIGPRLRSVVVGGAALNPEWARILSVFGIDLYLGYGLTEAGPILTCNKASDCPAGSVGKALPNVEIRIDADGEIMAAGPNIMSSYLNDAPLADGWLGTGDVGRLDSLGNLYIDGRNKEAMVASNGETIFPEEMEPYYQHPGFSDCCIVPLTGDDGNDVPTLVIYPAVHIPDIASVVNGLARRAPERLRTRNYIVLDSPFPRTELGKIQRRKLAEQLRER